jgi:hypothetical protein
MLKIADLTVQVEADERVGQLGVSPARREFLASESRPDVRVLATFDEPRASATGRVLFDASPVWRLRDVEGAHEISLDSLAFPGRPYATAVFSPDFSAGTVHLVHEAFCDCEPVDPLGHPLDELLWNNLLARGRGAEVHACGIIDPAGSGHLFVGVSGAGKTTMARLWERMIPGVVILSDDRVILRRESGRVWMHGTPWHGEGGMAVAAKHTLDRIHFLRKAPAMGATRLSADEAVARLLPCCFAPFHDRDGMDFTLGFLSEVAGEASCQELRVVPGPEVVSFVRDRELASC